MRRAPIILFLGALLLIPAALRADDDPRVYLRLAQGISEPLETVSDELVAGLEDAGWTVLAAFDAGTPEGCSYGARVVVAYSEATRARLLRHGPHAAYAIPTRFVVYEDETGVGIGATNPMSLYRTVVDEESPPEAWADVADGMRAVVAGAFPDAAVEGEYGQERGKARIGRTFGIMAGGPFVEKFKEVVTEPAQGYTAVQVARRIADGLPAVEGEWEWGIRPVYVLDLPEVGMALVGVTGEHMEARSFAIVKHGGADEREDMSCPGLDHAAAYPMEVAVSVLAGELQVRLVDVMFRMKMYFEDAGKMAFAKNMGMPGSIEDEVKDKIRAVLATPAVAAH